VSDQRALWVKGFLAPHIYKYDCIEVLRSSKILLLYYYIYSIERIEYLKGGCHFDHIYCFLPRTDHRRRSKWAMIFNIITVMVSHGGIKESSKARAGLDGSLVDTFSKSLESIHMDHRRSNRDHNAQNRRSQTTAPTKFNLKWKRDEI
jgi:hypothetical protein